MLTDTLSLEPGHLRDSAARQVYKPCVIWLIHQRKRHYFSGGFAVGKKWELISLLNSIKDLTVLFSHCSWVEKLKRVQNENALGFVMNSVQGQKSQTFRNKFQPIQKLSVFCAALSCRALCWEERQTQHKAEKQKDPTSVRHGHTDVLLHKPVTAHRKPCDLFWNSKFDNCY